MATRADDLRRFSAIRRRLTALQQESYSTTRALEVTDWRTRDVSQVAEFQALTNRAAAIDDEMNDIQFLLDYYERTVASVEAMVVTPRTVLVITALVLTLFVAMTVSAGMLAGALRVW